MTRKKIKRHGGRLMTIQGAQTVCRALAPRHMLETHRSVLAPRRTPDLHSGTPRDILKRGPDHAARALEGEARVSARRGSKVGPITDSASARQQPRDCSGLRSQRKLSAGTTPVLSAGPSRPVQSRQGQPAPDPDNRCFFRQQSARQGLHVERSGVTPSKGHLRGQDRR